MEHRTLSDVVTDALTSCEAVLRYPKPVNADSVRFWTLALRGQSPEVVSRAFDRWIHSKPDFPAPCEILELCQGIVKERTRAVLSFEPPDFGRLPRRDRCPGLTRNQALAITGKAVGNLRQLAVFEPSVPLNVAEPATETQMENPQ